jgi:hypothetical protein
VRSRLVVASAIARGQAMLPGHVELHPDEAALLAQRPRGKLAGLLAAERLLVARQLEQHYCTNGAATGAVHDAKVTGVKCDAWTAGVCTALHCIAVHCAELLRVPVFEVQLSLTVCVCIDHQCGGTLTTLSAHKPCAFYHPDCLFQFISKAPALSLQ